MKPHPGLNHRTAVVRRDCARDSVPDVDPMRIDVQIGERSDLPLEHWQERLKDKQRKRPPRARKPGQPERPPPAPDALIDDYAAPPH